MRTRQVFTSRALVDISTKFLYTDSIGGPAGWRLLENSKSNGERGGNEAKAQKNRQFLLLRSHTGTDADEYITILDT